MSLPPGLVVRPELALWLVPAAADGERLGAQIQELAGRFRDRRPTPRLFAPHVTLFGGVQAPREQVLAALAAVARETAPLRLAPAGYGHSARFFQCFFLAFGGAEVPALRRRLAPAAGKGPEDASRPHLSLLYAELPAAERASLARLLPPPAPILFDALEAVAPGDGAAGWDDVAGWHGIGRFALAGGG